MDFKDHFSKHAASYATFRPKAPRELFDYLASLVPEKKLAWDVGTGNGQAALKLVPYFDHVIATDASAEQIRNAAQHPQISYRAARAEEPVLEAHSANLITIAQALHWFEFDKFYAEVKRVAAPGAVISAWTYELAYVTPEIDKLCDRYYQTDIGRFWPAERKWVEEGYKTIPFPFEALTAPKLKMVEERSFEEFAGYLYTWSATQKAIEELGPDVFNKFAKELQTLWGPEGTIRNVTWPLSIRVGRVSALK